MAFNNSAGYNSGISSYFAPPTVLNKVVMQCHERSIVSRISRNSILNNEKMFFGINGEVIMPVENTSLDFLDDCHQNNSTGDGMKLNLTPRSLKMCGVWNDDIKIAQQEFMKLDVSDRKDWYMSLVKQKFERVLDARRDTIGLNKLVLSANAGNVLYDDANPYIVNSGDSFDELIREMSAELQSSYFCGMTDMAFISNAHIQSFGTMSQAYRLNTCCPDGKSALTTGQITHTLGFSLETTERLPYKIVGGRKIYRVLMVDRNSIGSPLKVYYMKSEQVLHDYVTYWHVEYDTFAYRPESIVVAHVALA